ncbi:RecQ family ATP-dependent DNA helicase [Shouchella lonarensis]|uniref:ATP-dependent DNA helicase RecQ n=1 Tax=Shouchella lonarensis TaxID=1464122 RepID=A0A1G6LEK4_9BACI|nr:ATP-dependent DNA helicase RecQ [Shouchella lonarensis]SDC41842.1 ATP-dependent DNA helicase RecQ [Shouchella lonarensis]
MLTRALKEKFGHETFKQGQREIIEALMAGHDVLAVLPTGRGKSLCYQLPALLLDGLTIVVSPLLSLMEDQVQQLKKNGIRRVAALNSFTDQQERQVILTQLSQLKLLYASPEMLQSKTVRKALKQTHIAMFVVDEAHCISHWGHDFRPDYLRLCQVRADVGSPRCLAMTATAPPRVQKDVMQQLRLENPRCFIESVNRENIFLNIEVVASAGEKVSRIEQCVSYYPSPGIIYVHSRNQAIQLCHHLREIYPTKNIAAYHGGMEQTDRLLVQQQFMHDQLDLICATNAFGMGLNKDDVRYVVHVHYPLDFAAYVQEIGRAGRDGQPAMALFLVTATDDEQAIQLLKQGQMKEKELAWVLASLTPGKVFDETKLEERVKHLGYDHTRAIVYLLEHWGAVLEGFVTTTFSSSVLATKISAYFQKRYEERRLRLRSIVNYVEEQNTCRRHMLLRYFQERPKKQAPCCDVCGLLPEIVKANDHVPQVAATQSWQTQLAQLFVVNERGTKSTCR